MKRPTPGSSQALLGPPKTKALAGRRPSKPTRSVQERRLVRKAAENWAVRHAPCAPPKQASRVRGQKFDEISTFLLQ